MGSRPTAPTWSPAVFVWLGRLDLPTQNQRTLRGSNRIAYLGTPAKRAEAEVDHHDLATRGWIQHRHAHGGVQLDPTTATGHSVRAGVMGHYARVECVRIFADEQGLSHFEDVELDLERQHVADGVPRSSSRGRSPLRASRSSSKWAVKS